MIPCPNPSFALLSARTVSSVLLLSHHFPTKPIGLIFEAQHSRQRENGLGYLEAAPAGPNSDEPVRDNCVEFVDDLIFDDEYVVDDSIETRVLADEVAKFGWSGEENFWENLGISLPVESVLYLNAVAVIWGTQHPVIKMVVNDCDPSVFSLVRFALGALLATPAWLSTRNRNTDGKRFPEQNQQLSKLWRWGAEMGLWMFLGYAFQAVGLEFTTAQRSGFLLYLNVKFVPFFAFLLLGRSISLATWASALGAVVGTALLSCDGGSLDLNRGDLWSIAAAVASAMYILRLEAASKEVEDSVSLNAACLWTVTMGALFWSAAISSWDMRSLVVDVFQTFEMHPLEILYLGGVTTALANYIQTKVQKDVAAERASIIYAMDPVYGAIFSNLLLGETLSSLGVIGAGCITIAAAAAASGV